MLEHASPDFSVSVNVTAEQINDTAFIDQVILLAQKYHAAGHLCMEIVEDSPLDSFDSLADNLEKLRLNNIVASIDDFSMGHTSIKYLQNNFFRYVKLDGTLVRQVPNNPRSKEIVRSIIQLGDELGFKVIAEYVENDVIRQELAKLGCEYYQGFLYKPAIPLDEFLQYNPQQSAVH